jgi:alpha-tubulin suppressor-like RCC1 family protein
MIAPDGSLWWWGDTLPGFGARQPTPKRIGDSHDWVQVQAGQQYGVALKADRSLWIIGEMPAFRNGMDKNTGHIVEIMPGTKWRQITADQMHVLALREDGSLWAWGDNSMSELGDGTNMQSPIPLQVGSDTNWTSVGAGQMTSLAIKSDGSLWHWGAISFAMSAPNAYVPVPQRSPLQFGTNSDWQGFKQGASGVLAIKKDGSLWSYPPYWGMAVGISANSSVQLLGTNTDWASLAGGWPQAWGVKSNGTLWSWTSLGPRAAPGPPRRFDRRSDWQGVWAGGFGGTDVGLTADRQVWSWGTMIGMPLQESTGVRRAAERILSRVLGQPFHIGLSYPSAREPWVIMRFETNAPATLPQSK